MKGRRPPFQSPIQRKLWMPRTRLENRTTLLRPRFVRVAIWVAAVLVSTLAQRADAAVEIARADVGFNGVYHVGVWVPVTVELRSDSDVRGTLRLVVPDGDGVPSTITQPGDEPISLRAGAPTTARLLARFGRLRGWFEVRFEEEDGTQTKRRFEASGEGAKADEFPQGLPTRRRLVLQLGKDSIGLDKALKGEMYDADAGDALVRLDSAELLPRSWLGYEGVQTLVLVGRAGSTAEELAGDARRVEAIRRWVAMGGKLVVFVGGAGKTILGGESAIASLIPGRFESTASLRRTGEYEAYCGSEKPIPLSRRRTVTIDVPKLVDVEGRIEAREGDVPLVVRAAVGFGTVTFVACDPGESPWSEWVDRAKFLRTVLGRPTREVSRLGERRAIMHYGYDDLAGQLRAALDRFEGVRFVPLSLIVLLLIAYLLLIGPVDYFFVGKILGRRRITWITFPAVVLIASFAGYWLSYQFKGNEVRVNQADVVDVDVKTGLVRGTAWANVFSPAMETYDIEFSPRKASKDERRFGDRYTAWLGLPGSGIGGMEPRADTVFWKKGYAFSPPLTGMDGVPIAVWSSKSVTSRWHGETVDVPEGTFSRDARTLVGRFANRAGYPLKNCFIAFERWVYRVGDVGPGKTVEVGTMTERMEIKALLNERKLVKDKEKDQFRQEATPYDRGSLDPYYVLRMMLFFEAGGGEAYTGLDDNYQGFLDMSGILELDRAVLFAQVPAEKAGAVLRCNDREMTNGPTRRISLRRFVFPVESLPNE